MWSLARARRHTGARPAGPAGRWMLAALIAGAVALAPAAAVPARPARQACAAATVAPGSAADATLRRALRCLVNAERVNRGLRPLRAGRRLGAAARRHA